MDEEEEEEAVAGEGQGGCARWGLGWGRWDRGSRA